MAHDLHNVPPLAHRNHRGIGPKPCWVYADDDRRRQILVLGPLHRIIDDIGCDKLIIPRIWELTVHLNVRLGRVRPVFVNNLLINSLIRPLDLPCIDYFCLPKLPFGVKTLVKIAGIAPWVAKRHPKAVWCVFREETRRHSPD